MWTVIDNLVHHYDSSYCYYASYGILLLSNMHYYNYTMTITHHTIACHNLSLP